MGAITKVLSLMTFFGVMIHQGHAASVSDPRVFINKVATGSSRQAALPPQALASLANAKQISSSSNTDSTSISNPAQKHAKSRLSAFFLSKPNWFFPVPEPDNDDDLESDPADDISFVRLDRERNFKRVGTVPRGPHWMPPQRFMGKPTSERLSSFNTVAGDREVPFRFGMGLMG